MLTKEKESEGTMKESVEKRGKKGQRNLLQKVRYYYLVLLLVFATLGIVGCGSKAKKDNKQEQIQEVVQEGNSDNTQQVEGQDNQESSQNEGQEVENEGQEVENGGQEAGNGENTTGTSDSTEAQEGLGEETSTTASNMKVTFLDVGEGNATLVEIDGKFMLIDGGDREYSSFVVSYLKKQGVQTLDYVVVSHFDADHLNGVVGALNAFNIANIIAPQYSMDTRVYNSYVSRVQELGITPLVPRVGDTYNFMGATLEIVGPAHFNHKDVNDNSIVVRLVNGNNSFLFTADAEEASEEEMLAAGVNLKSDVFNVGHHGSGSSSSSRFLDAVAPTYGVISVGKGNSYGHPAESTMSRLQQRNIIMFRSDEQGTIEAVSDGTNITWNVEASNNWAPGGGGTSGGSQTIPLPKEPEPQITTQGTTEENGAAVPGGEQQANESTYVLNNNTMKFHSPGCSSVKTIKFNNRGDFTGNREELIGQGYEPCKRCNP